MCTNKLGRECAVIIKAWAGMKEKLNTEKAVRVEMSLISKPI